MTTLPRGATSTTARPESRQPIPTYAQRVFQGNLFDVYQWEQTQFDGSVAIFEKLRRPDTAYVLPVIGSRLLIVQQEQPGSDRAYGLIGGRVEPGESPAETARRELAEEAGLAARGVELWDAYQFLPKIDWAIYTFIARDCHPAPRAPDAGERIEVLEVTFDELLELASSDAFGDLEVALHLLRLAVHPDKRAAARSAIFGPACDGVLRPGIDPGS